MIHIKDNIYFDETKPLEEQSDLFQSYAEGVFMVNDYTDMSNLVGYECTWVIEQDGLRYTANRVYQNTKWYTVRKYLFTVELI